MHEADPISPAVKQAKPQGQRSLQGWQAQSQGQPSHRDLAPETKTTDTVLRLHVNNVVQTLTSSGKNVELSTRNVTIVGDLDISQRCVDEIQTTEAARLRLTTYTQKNSLQTMPKVSI